MEVVSRSPSIKLRSLVEEFWHVEFDKHEDVARTDIIIPTGNMHIVFNLSNEYYLMDELENSKKLPDVLISGQLDRALKISYGESTNQIGIVLKPLGFLKLFHMPGILYSGMFIDGSPPPWGLANLYSMLRDSIDFDDSVKSLESYILDNTDSYENPERINRILEDIDMGRGNVNIQELAQSNDFSISAFERYFKKMIGMSPKAYANIVRFREVITLNESDEVLNHFYDQSHFIKSCRKYTGKTPAELMKGNEEITLDYMLKRR